MQPYSAPLINWFWVGLGMAIRQVHCTRVNESKCEYNNAYDASRYIGQLVRFVIVEWGRRHNRRGKGTRHGKKKKLDAKE